jgi:hypothetical protein
MKKYHQHLLVNSLIIAMLGSLIALSGCNNDPVIPSNQRVIDMASIYTQWLYGGNYKSIWDYTSPRFQDTIPTMNDLVSYGQAILGLLGPETGVLDERVLYLDNVRLYERSAAFQNMPVPVDVAWMLTSQNQIISLEFYPLFPEAESPFLDYETKTPLRLPFDNEWVVIWGGRTTLDNYHAPVANQRFATDFFKFENGFYYSGNGSVNEDHYCFGEPIKAVADGIVIETANDVYDNPPWSEDNLDAPLGNHVILDHQNGEYSLYGHFKEGSVMVNVGDHVVAGQTIALCGNSGASDIPHLHYELMNTPYIDISGSSTQCLPAQFSNYYANGVLVSRGEPTRGQRVRNR